MTAAAWRWARADWRTRRAAVLSLGLLAGLAGAVVLAGVAGARRTATSVERLQAVGLAADALVDVGGGGLDAAEAIADLPSVSVAGPVTLVFAVVDVPDPREIDVGLVLPRTDAFGHDVERDLLVEGRLPDRARPDEVAVNVATASLLDLEVGREVRIGTLSPEQVDAERYGTPEGPEIVATITGIVRGTEDLVAREEGLFTGTPGMYEAIAGEVDEFAMYVAVVLRAGADLEELAAQVDAISPADDPFDLLPATQRDVAARRTVSTLATGLAAFAVAAGLVASVVVGQAVGRHIAAVGGDARSLRALGMPARHRVLALATTAVPAIVLGPLVAVVVAVAASAVTPIGLARDAEPDRGVRADWPVLLVGAIAIAGLLLVAALASGARAARLTAARPRHGLPGAAAVAARWGAPAPVTVGVGFAADRRTGSAPRRTSVAALIVATASGAGAVAFLGSADRLVDDPGRWGSPWDLSLDFTSDEVDGAAAELAADPMLATAARWDAGFALVDGQPTRAFGVGAVRGRQGFTLIEGAQPGPGEVVLGPRTAEDLGVRVGGTLAVGPVEGGSGERTLEVAGLAVFPEIDEGEFSDAIGMISDDFRELASVPDQFEANQVVVGVADGRTIEEVAEALEARYGQALAGATPLRPGVVGNLGELRPIVRALVLFAAVLWVATLTHAVRSTRRRRLDELRVLRAIGMTGRQLRRCSTAFSAALAAIALLVGVPLGLAAGRRTWSAVAAASDLPLDAAVPALPVVAITVVGVLLALTIGAVAGSPVPTAAPGPGTSDPA